VHTAGLPKLIKQLTQEYDNIKKQFDHILRTTYGYIGKFLSEPAASLASSVNRYSSTRTTSSKMNAVLTSLMLKYTNALIYHLLKAGEAIQTDPHNIHHINLVSFRVSDLMRSKLQCSESSLISLLNTMYLMDNSETMHGKFKLVRIKNKLDDPANNIMVNYLFMGKVQCELQLSIKEAKIKEKNYYTFSHFVYELVRGKFGSIAECAIMISQLDPMITACKQPYYEEKITPVHKFKHSKSHKEQIPIEKNIMIESRLSEILEFVIKPTFFECSECSKLIMSEKTEKLLSASERDICYHCFINKQEDPESLLKDELKNIFEPL
jgi:hypothetical protein